MFVFLDVSDRMIGHLGFTPRSNETLKTYFNGKIQTAKFTKMVESVSTEEFPPYPVRSMIIEAHEARRINASSFVNYRNLHGLHLIRPKFFFDNRSFDGLQYLSDLETLELDAETIRGRVNDTFLIIFSDKTFLFPNRSHISTCLTYSIVDPWCKYSLSLRAFVGSRESFTTFRCFKSCA